MLRSIGQNYDVYPEPMEVVEMLRVRIPRDRRN